ncbi:cadherin-like domain-containing protein [Photobacterium japonica]|uniref:tandem-95 repeat protein n=1 Tax=Photobacterium japonica TaxID=2910235 RepID=UPI003D12E0D8
MARNTHQGRENEKDSTLNNAVEHQATPDKGTDEHRAAERDNQQSTLAATTATGAESADQNTHANRVSDSDPAPEDPTQQGNQRQVEESTDAQDASQSNRASEVDETQPVNNGRDETEYGGPVGGQAVGGNAPARSASQDTDDNGRGENVASSGDTDSASAGTSGGVASGQQSEAVDTATTSETFEVDVANAVTKEAIEDEFDTATMSETFEIQIDDVNDDVVIDTDAPAISISGVEDNQVVITEAELLANASDVDGDTLTVTTLTIDNATVETRVDPETGDKSFVVTPDADVNGPLEMQYTVSDQQGSEVASTATLDVTAVNDAAVMAQDTEVTGTEDTDVVFTQAMLLEHATDIDSDNLTAENLTIAPEYGEVVDNGDGTFTFTPAQDFNGDVPFTFDVNDNDGAITPASGNVDLAAANDAPVLAETSFTLNEDGAITIDPAALLENATDIDGDVLSISNITSDANGSVTQNDQGEWVYTPNEDYSGEAELTITVFDGTAHTDFTAPVTVTPDADVPSLTVSLTDTSPDAGGGQPTIQIFNVNQQIQPVSPANTFDEDTPVPLNITAAVTDTDGSESIQSLVLDDVPNGATLTDGTHTFTAEEGSNSVDITDWDVAQITFQGEDNFHGSVSLSLTATSQEDSTLLGDTPETASTTTTIDFDIVPVNDEVEIDGNESLDFATQEDTAIVITEAELLANASDVDGDSLMATNVTMDNGSAQLVVDPDSGERSFVITPDQNVNGDFTLHFDVSDGNGSVVASNAQLTVSPENDAAVVAQDTDVTGTEDTDVVFTQAMLLEHATDIDSDNLTAENLTIAPEYGEVVDNGDGTFTFTPAQDFNGDVPFTFDVNDNDGAITPASGNIDLAASNDAAVVAQDTDVTGSEDTDVVFTQEMLLEHATDIDSDNLTAENLSIAPEYGEVVDNGDGTFTFTPTADYNGDVPFTFDVNDNDGAITPASGNIDLAASNDAAVVAQDTDVTGTEDTGVVFTQEMLLEHATDIDSDNLTAENLQIAPEYGEVVDNGDGTFTFTPAQDFNGDVPFTFDVNDNDGAITPASGSLDVASENDAVVIDTDAPVSVSGVEDNQVVITEAELLANASDADGDDLSVSDLTIDNATVETRVDPETGDKTFVVTPDADVNGPLEMQFTVSDQQGSEVASTATLDVAAVNDAAVVAQDTDVSGTEDTDVVFTQAMLLEHATDIDSDNLTAENLQIAPEYGEVVDNGDGTFTFTPAQDFNGDVPFTFDVNDNDGAITPASGNLDLAAANDAAVVAQDTDVTGTEDTDVVFTQAMLLEHATDIDSDNLTAENLHIAPEYGEVVDNGDGTFTFTPAQDFNGDVPFTFDVNDNDGAITPASGNLDLAAANDAAVVAQDTDVTGSEDTDVIFTQEMLLEHATDIDSDNLTAENLQIAPEYGEVVDNGDGTFTFTPAQDYNGDVPFTFDVNDNDGAITPASGNLELAAVNDAAVVAQDTDVTGTEDTDVVFTQEMLLEHATDIDSDNLTAENLTIAPEYGEVVDNGDGTFTFTPAQDFNGDVPFTFDVNDNDGAITPASGNIDLAAANDAAVVAQDTDVTGSEDTDVVFTQEMLLEHATDIDSDNLTAENLTIAPEYGEVVDNGDGTFTFTPAQDFNGDVPFTFDVNDNDGAITPASGNLELAAVNDAAVVAQDTDVTGSEDTDVVFTQAMLLEHATDIDSDNLTAENLTIAPKYGEVVDNGDGTFTFTPAQDFNGDVPFTFDVNDNDGAITPASGSLDVAAVNDEVIAADDSRLDGETPMIRLEAVPTHGSVQCLDQDGEWADMQVGVEYPANTQVQFVPDAEDVQAGTRDIRVGSFDSDTSTQIFDGTAKVEDWGEVDGNTVVYKEDGVTITTEVNTGELAAWNGAGSHMGAGIGNESRNGLDTNEMLTVTVEGEDVNQITFQLDGLGGYFDETSRNATEVLITAYDEDGNLIDAQGGYRESGEYQDSYVFTTDVPVHHFTLGTTGSNGTYVVQNMTVSRTMSDEIQMTTIQPDGSEVLNAVSLDLNHSAANDPIDVTEQLVDVDHSITSRPIEVEEDGQLIINPAELLKNDTDADGDVLTIVGVEATDDTHGEVSLDDDGNVVFTPEADYNGPASFTYIVSDGNGSTDTATVTVDVTPVDDEPVAPTVMMSGDEDQVLVIDPAYILKQASDADGDQLSLESLSLKQPPTGQLQLQQDGMYHLITPPDFNGLIELDYQVSDGDNIVDGSMKVDVVPVNDAPFHGGNAQLTTYEDGAFTFNADDMLDLFGDIDGDDLVVSKVITTDGEEGGEVTQNEDGTWTFTPAENYAGTAELQVEVSDPSGATTLLEMPVFIRPVADGAVITTDHDGPLVFDEDTTGLLGLNVDMVDTSEQLSHLVITGFPVGFEVSDGVNSIVITEPGQVVDITEWSFNDLALTPPENFSGNFFVTVSATTADYGEESSSQLSEPTDGYADFSTAQDDTLLLTVDDLLDMADGIDTQDSDSVQGVHLIDRSQGELTDNGDGTWSFVPSDGFTGDVDFAYQVQQGESLVDVQSSISVDDTPDPDANQAPTVDQIVTTDLGAGNTLTFTPQDMLAQLSDSEGETLSIESVQLISGQGVLETQADGSYSFTPAEGYSGEAQIAFVATDGEASVRSHFNVDVAEAESSGDFMLDDMGALILTAADMRESLGLDDAVAVTQVDYHGEAGTLLEEGDSQWVFWSDDDFAGQLDVEVTTQEGDMSSVHELSLTVDEYQELGAQQQAFSANRAEDPDGADNAPADVDTETVAEDGAQDEPAGADVTAAPGSEVRLSLPDEITDNADVQQVEISNLPDGASLNTGIADGEGAYTISGDLSQPITMTLPKEGEGTTTIHLEGQTEIGTPVDGAESSITIEVDEAYAMQSGARPSESPQGIQDDTAQGDWTQGDNTNQGVDVMDDSASYDNDNAGGQQEEAGMMDDSYQ